MFDNHLLSASGQVFNYSACVCKTNCKTNEDKLFAITKKRMSVQLREIWSFSTLHLMIPYRTLTCHVIVIRNHSFLTTMVWWRQQQIHRWRSLSSNVFQCSVFDFSFSYNYFKRVFKWIISKVMKVFCVKSWFIPHSKTGMLLKVTFSKMIQLKWIWAIYCKAILFNMLFFTIIVCKGSHILEWLNINLFISCTATWGIR